MEHRPFGPTGRDVPVIGMGTWKMQDAKAMQAALRAGLDAGLTHIDTAELYEGSEAAIAPVLAEWPRDDVWLVSKVLPKNASRKGTVAHCKATLDRLGTEHLDVYLLHWAGDHPIEETMTGMAELLDAGLIRHAGVSNLDVAQLEEAQDALGGHALACDQVLYHPGRREIEHGLLPFCRRHDIAVVGYSSFASGRLLGDDRMERLEAIGREHGRTAAQVVLDALSRDEDVFLIPKSEDPKHVRENAAALDERLPQEAYDAFDEMFPSEPGAPWVVS